MNTVQYIDAVKKKLGIESDYAVAKALGISKQAVCRYTQGKGAFDDEIAIRVAEMLDIAPAKVLLDCHMERSKNPQVQAVWFGLMEKFSASFNSLISCATPRRAYHPA